MKSYAYCLALFGILCIILASAAVTSGEIEDYPTTFKIEVRDDGSAIWIVEYRSSLDTAEEENFFRQYISQFENLKDDYLENFSNEMTSLVQRASIVTGRSMEAKNFDISVGILETATGKFGIIKYQFEWVNFAKLEEGRIIIGDVFEAGLYLYKDDALVILYPSGYTVDTALPTPDDTRGPELIWYGQRDFGSGEPRVVLGKPTAFPLLWVIAGIVVLAVAIGVAFWFRKMRVPHKVEEERPLVEELVTKTDVERVVDLLKEARGKLYQSDIMKKTGFSKPKTSVLLKSMEEAGTIERTRMGRKNLVVLKTHDTSV